jgi:hypothetical protein
MEKVAMQFASIPDQSKCFRKLYQRPCVTVHIERAAGNGSGCRAGWVYIRDLPRRWRLWLCKPLCGSFEQFVNHCLVGLLAPARHAAEAAKQAWVDPNGDKLFGVG